MKKAPTAASSAFPRNKREASIMTTLILDEMQQLGVDRCVAVCIVADVRW
jgi:hypothetical protein